MEIWRGKEDLDRERSLGGNDGRGIGLCIRGKIQTGQCFWRVNVKASKALHSRMLAINRSDSWLEKQMIITCIILFNPDNIPWVETALYPPESILHFF